MTDTELDRQFTLLKRFALLAFAGAIVFAAIVGSNSTILNSQLTATFGTWTLFGLSVAGLAIIPLAFYVVALSIWHWKSRYSGQHSKLWGLLLVLEVSGWFKLIYLFRHIVPDARRAGRYARANADRGA